MHASPALGGLLVAALILSPESLSAIRAALANQLQRSVNILLGTVLATIGLTVPAVRTIGFLTGQAMVLGVDPVDTTLLLLTLAISTLTFSSTRTNVLLAAVHLLLFLAYLMLVFEKQAKIWREAVAFGHPLRVLCSVSSLPLPFVVSPLC